MSDKQVRAQFTQKFKLEAVHQVRAGQAISVVAKVRGILGAHFWGHRKTRKSAPTVPQNIAASTGRKRTQQDKKNPALL